jgi:hypothetical protein
MRDTQALYPVPPACGEPIAPYELRVDERGNRRIHSMVWHTMKQTLVLILLNLLVSSAIAQERDNATDGLLARLQSLQVQLDKQQQLIRSLEERFDRHAIAEKTLIESLSTRSPRLDCQSVSAAGQRAVCPSGYLATGCAAGQNKGSHSIQNANTCVTDQAADWTAAHCCRTIW